MIDPATILVFLFSIAIHEYAHAWTAVRLGDPTPQQEGRLTLNVIKHLSLPGLLMLLIAGIGWAKPVRVNPMNFRRPAKDMLWVSCAGPVANLLLAVAFAIVWRMGLGISSEFIAVLVLTGTHLNILLALFNLIPMPPLDGSKLLTPLLPSRWLWYIHQAEPWGFLILFVALNYLGLGTLLSQITSFLARLLLL